VSWNSVGRGLNSCSCTFFSFTPWRSSRMSWTHSRAWHRNRNGISPGSWALSTQTFLHLRSGGARVLPSPCVPGCQAQPVASPPAAHPPPASAASRTTCWLVQKVGEWQTQGAVLTALPSMGRFLTTQLSLNWLKSWLWGPGFGAGETSESLEPPCHLLPSDPHAPGGTVSSIGGTDRCRNPYLYKSSPSPSRSQFSQHLLKDTLARPCTHPFSWASTLLL
jgi:hypothetical protein